MQNIHPLATRLRPPVHEIEPTVTLRRRWRLLLWSANVILLRHAERVAGTNPDPTLSAAGHARAALLAQMLADEPLAAVYVTQFQRSVLTGTPTAQAKGLPVTSYAATDAAGLAAAIRTGQPSQSVLVVGHSNTVDDIAAALGAPAVGELAEDQFDRMFVIARTWCGTRLTRLRYGAPTP